MATSIPPHNAAELIEAARHLIDNPLATDAMPNPTSQSCQINEQLREYKGGT
jgi:DNA gyrase/topoisomerase IV subunit A